jgi:hypothetical protein
VNIAKDAAAVTAFARAVAAKRATITAAAAVGAEVLIAHHVITPGVAGNVNQVLAWALGAAAFLGGVSWIHQGVTPADVAMAPKSSTGQQLVEASVAALAVQAAYDSATQVDTSGLSDETLAHLDQVAAVPADSEPDPPAADAAAAQPAPTA